MILRSTKAGHSLLTSLASCLAPAQPAIPPEGAKMTHLKLPTTMPTTMPTTTTTAIKKHHCFERGLISFILKKKHVLFFEGEGFFGLETVVGFCFAGGKRRAYKTRQ